MTKTSASFPGIRRGEGAGRRRIVSPNLLGRLTSNCCVHVSLQSGPQQRRVWILTTSAVSYYSENNETPFRLRSQLHIAQLPFDSLTISDIITV